MTKILAILSSVLLVAVSACSHHQLVEQKLAIGDISQTQLMTNHQSFRQRYQDFQLTEQEIAEVRSWPNNLHVTVYFGSWCHDSQREVPKFLKIVAENITLSYRLIGLDHNKTDPNGFANMHEIKFTPTFIVYQGSKEVGRIIERPTVSLIADITAML